MGLQDVGEQVVVAVPPAAVVERDEKQVRPVEGLQRLPTVVPAGDRVAQRAAQPAEDRGLQQKGPDLLRLALQHLLDQVVDDVPVVDRKSTRLNSSHANISYAVFCLK